MVICPICKGSGSLLTFKPMSWWQCPCCGGAGSKITGTAPPTIKAPRLELAKYAKIKRKAEARAARLKTPVAD